jgi:abortive infection bacteriophage resistance protein
MQYATDAQLELLTAEFVEYIENNEESVPANMAREYKVLVDAVCYQEVEAFDAQGEPESMALINEWASNLAKPVKTVKVTTSDLMARLQAAEAAMTAAGLTLPA